MASALLSNPIMQTPFPHHYVVRSVVGPEPEVVIETAGVAPLRTALPAEFGGAGNRWSPETLFVAAVADCYAITFRGIASKSKLAWTSLRLDVQGTLDRVSDVTRFTEIHIHAHLFVPECASESLATRVLTKAEQTCLITRSLTAKIELTMSVDCLEKRAPAA